MANGANEGIRHSFRVTKDAFAQGDNALVNHKTYYFMALAYGYNNYEDYDPITGLDKTCSTRPLGRLPWVPSACTAARPTSQRWNRAALILPPTATV